MGGGERQDEPHLDDEIQRLSAIRRTPRGVSAPPRPQLNAHRLREPATEHVRRTRDIDRDRPAERLAVGDLQLAPQRDAALV